MDTSLSEVVEDITPEDSACPIYRVPIPEEMQVEMDRLNAEAERVKEEEDSRELARQSALAKLAKLGLTEEEAKAVIGL
jgi:hypothetical protein